MRDKRPVDELSIEELERVLAIKKRAARQNQMARMKRSGRVIETAQDTPVRPVPAPQPEQHATAEHPPQPALPEKKTRRSPPPIKSSGSPQFEDDADWAQEQPVPPQNDETWRRFVDVALLLVEVAAVIGLIAIGVVLVGEIGDLEKETRESQERDNATLIATIPTLQPTPVLALSIDDFVLPTGHTIDENGYASFNIEEIPENVPVMVRNQVQRPVIERPEPTSSTAILVNIPRLDNFNQAIVQGTDWEALKQGVGQVLNGAVPGGVAGNVVLAAHNDIYGELFRHIDQLQEGDEIFIQTATQTYTYYVTGWETVDPTDVQVMDDKGRPTLTLVSCYPYGVNNKRYIVYAERSDNFQAYSPIKNRVAS